MHRSSMRFLAFSPPGIGLAKNPVIVTDTT
jgi:hypothetical protein